MKKITKIWLIVAGSLILLGGILFVGVMAALKWDFMKLPTAVYEKNLYEVQENFYGISIETDTADITFALSDNEACKVECYEEKNANHLVGVQDGTLVITAQNKAWYEYIGVNFDSPKITVYLPEKEYGALNIDGATGDVEIPKDFAFQDVDIALSTGDVVFRAAAAKDVKIETSTGSICVENTSVNELKLSVSTGKVTLSDITCQSVVSDGGTGDIYLSNVIALGKFSIERGTGDVKFVDSDAAEIFVVTGTGSVTGTLLTDKVFLVETGTGKVDVPKSIEGGRCEIETGTGSVKLSISHKE